MRKQVAAILLAVALFFPSIFSVQALEVLTVSRPDYPTAINETLQSQANDSCSVLGLGVDLYEYSNSYEGVNAVFLNASCVANSRYGINYYEQKGTLADTDTWLTESGSTSIKNLTFGGSANNTGVWVSLPLPTGPPQGMWFRYYGVTYKNVIDGNSGVVNCSIWICTNGFISLDDSNSTTPYSCGMPSTSPPNAVIAPLWTHLGFDEQSSISVRVPNDYDHQDDVVVLWKNVYADNNPNERLTFSVGLQGYPAYLDRDGQQEPETYVEMAYLNVSSISDRFTYGIEDQQGLKGVGESFSDGSVLGAFNNTYKYFSAYSAGDEAYLKDLKLTLTDNCTDTRYEIPNNCLSGYNLMDLNDSAPDLLMEKAVSLASAADGTIDAGGTVLHMIDNTALEGLLPWLLPVSAILIGYDLYKFLFQSQLATNEVAPDWYVNTQLPTAYVNASTANSATVDACLNTYVNWILTDSYPYESHNLTITVYADYSWSGQNFEIACSVNVLIAPDSNLTFQTATPLNLGPQNVVQTIGTDDMPYIGPIYFTQNYYEIYLGEGYNISVSVQPDLNLGVNLYLLDPDNNTVVQSTGGGEGGALEQIQYVASMSGDYIIQINRWAGNGFYNLSYATNLVGDINLDGIVDIYDALILAGAFGSSPGKPNWNSVADLNGDGTVDVYDAIILSANFGQSYQAGNGASGQQMLVRTMAEGGASVLVNPSQTTVFKGETFAVNVNVASVTNLQGWEFQLYWNNSVLNCTNVAVQTPSVWQNHTQNFGAGLEPNYNTTCACYWQAQTGTYPASSFNGSMTIVTLTFKALQPGTTSLTLADVKLGNSTAQPIACSVSSGSVTVYYGRYMRSDTQTINGLGAYVLNIPESGSYNYVTQSGSGQGAEWGIRAFVRHSNGSEQEISLDGQTGTPKALVYGGGGSGLQSATVAVTQTGLQSTDSLVIRVYVSIGESGWTQEATFTTERLNATTLKAATWTVYYYTQYSYLRQYNLTTSKFYWGTTTYESRIQNLQYS